MADKEFLEPMLSMLPEEYQDIYDDTIPEAKEVRKKMGKKVSSVKSYSCSMPLFEDFRHQEAYVRHLSGKKATISNEIKYISGATIEIDRSFSENVE